MSKHYYLHRISHEWQVSYPFLLDTGYLTMGWSDYKDSDVMERSRNNNLNAFKSFMKEKNEKRRGRWCIWYFSQFSKGDYIVVPMFDSKFCVYEVLGDPKSITSLEGLSFKLYKDNTMAYVTRDGIQDENGKKYDIGFVVPVKKVFDSPKPRNYATDRLVARMKIRCTNALIDDISQDVDASITSTGPVDIHEQIIKAIQEPILETIGVYLTPDKLEKVVKWYFEKQGADQVWIPAKNEPGKDNGADADVIAIFSDLNITFYVQVKKHNNTTGDWAVTQISNYIDAANEEKDSDIEEKDSLTTNIAWVISMANDYDEKAKNHAKEKNVRLINGREFIEMVMNSGIDGIETINYSESKKK